MPRDAQMHLPLHRHPPAPTDTVGLARAAARALNADPEDFAVVRLLKVSLDARRKHRGWSVAMRTWAPGEEVPELPATSPPELSRVPDNAPTVVVIGSGPAGLFCALDLVASGVRAIVLERGKDARARRKSIRAVHRGEEVDPDSNYCFGEGGAGTYSDGKLYARSGKKRAIRQVLRDLVAHGAPPEILWSWRPHVGSNRLPEVVTALRETIRRAGGEVCFQERAEELDVEGARVCAVRSRDLATGELRRRECDAVVLATGHSALDALRMAAGAGARLEAKGFAMGVRIEHPQDWLDQRQYSGAREHFDLPAAFYELTAQSEGRGVYSFCMCPGGFIVPATTDGDRVVVNGMSLSRRDSPFANSGLVVALEPEDWCGERGAAWGWPDLLRKAARLGQSDVPPSGALPSRPEDDPLFGVRLQLALERVNASAGGGRQRAPSQRADLVLEARGRTSEPNASSYSPGLAGVDLAEVLPPGILSRLRHGLSTFDGRLPGFGNDISQLVGVESRTSSPVRIARDPGTLEAHGVAGLYPSGEGAGFAGGIVSAALDGRRVAEAILAVLASS